MRMVVRAPRSAALRTVEGSTRRSRAISWKVMVPASVAGALMSLSCVVLPLLATLASNVSGRNRGTAGNRGTTGPGCGIIRGVTDENPQVAPAYRVLAEELIASIRAGARSPGERLPTIAVLAGSSDPLPR